MKFLFCVIKSIHIQINKNKQTHEFKLMYQMCDDKNKIKKYYEKRMQS